MDVDRLAVVGTSFRQVGFERLARLALPEPEFGALADLRRDFGAREIVYVATCNRVECYLAFGPGERVEAPRLCERAIEVLSRRSGAPFDGASLFALAGRGALEHLFRVAASLESLAVGEAEVLGQLRRAADRAAALGLSGPLLRRTFERAARAARRVRGETAIGRTPVSVASLCARRVREHFAAAPPRLAAVIGTGEVSRKLAGALCELGAPILFANRTFEKAKALAARFGGEAVPLERFRAGVPARLDVVVTATSAPGAILDERALAPALADRPEGPLRRLLVCDLGLPPDVAPEVASLPGAKLLALADLEPLARENRARLETEVARAEAIVREEVAAALRLDRLRSVAAESVDALLAGALAHLDGEDRETLRRFATNLAERLARQPG
jgi:glutamyl-tRNA reductase